MIHVNQKGYSTRSGMRAVYQCDSAVKLREASVVCAFSGSVMIPLQIGTLQVVPGWKGRFFQKIWVSESPLPLETGRYRISGITEQGNTVYSENFTVRDELIAERDLSDLIVYFKAMRCDGHYDEADRNVPVWGSDERQDARGGWYDASGDTSKYLSHLSYAGRMNPQQTPLVVWILSDLICRYDDSGLWTGKNFRKWLSFEMNHGADFLLRMQHPEGWFYTTLFDQWSKDPGARMLCSYKTQKGERLTTMRAGFREGGGMACAALASASCCSDSTGRQEYLQSAAKGYAYLQEHNHEMLEGGSENLIDWFCALTAAIELHRAGGEKEYLSDIADWTEKIRSSFHVFNDREGWWFVDPENKVPFYHASDEGLLIIALKKALPYLSESLGGEVESMLDLAFGFLNNSLLADPDPFDYPRHWVEDIDVPLFKWFYPHDNPSGYWWQGENSRISSLGAALLYGSPRRESEGKKLPLAVHDWQLGLNPFNISMVDGWGASNPQYEADYYNIQGGVANGITSALDDENDIAFQPRTEGDSGDHSWRWGEQWIPHAAWYLMLISLLREGKF